jgi:hypothetical protein
MASKLLRNVSPNLWSRALSVTNRTLTFIVGAGFVVLSTYAAISLIWDAIALVLAGQASFALLIGLVAVVGMLIPLAVALSGLRQWIVGHRTYDFPKPNAKRQAP